MKARTLMKTMNRFEDPIRAQMNDDFAPLEALFQAHIHRGF